MPGEREQVADTVEQSTLPYANIVQTLALGLLVLSKHDRAEARHGASFSNTQLANFDRFTDGELNRFQEQAAIMLNQYGVLLAIPRGDPPTTWESIKDWLWGFGQAYIGAILWSLSLLIVAVLVRYGGGDLIDIFAKWVKPTG